MFLEWSSWSRMSSYVYDMCKIFCFGSHGYYWTYFFGYFQVGLFVSVMFTRGAGALYLSGGRERRCFGIRRGRRFSWDDKQFHLKDTTRNTRRNEECGTRDSSKTSSSRGTSSNAGISNRG